MDYGAKAPQGRGQMVLFASPVSEVLADTRSLTGINLHELQQRGVTLFAPSKQTDPATNPARHADLSQPVPEDQRDQLPNKTTKHKDGTQTTQLTKDAFVYEQANDCYWCPHGQALKPRTTSTEKQVGGTLTCTRYAAPASACAACPLRAKCQSAKADHREISRYQHDDLIEAHTQRMTTPEAKKKYAVRQYRGERPFAHIKQHFCARQFLLRGLNNVRIEWTWLTSAFNLRPLITLLQPRPQTGDHPRRPLTRQKYRPASPSKPRHAPGKWENQAPCKTPDNINRPVSPLAKSGDVSLTHRETHADPELPRSEFPLR